MQALILAAGRGSRLGNKSHDIPKCLLEVGRCSIVEQQLEALAEAGVGPVGMVLGYCADEIKEVVGIRAEYMMNPRWRNTNSLYSFGLTREWVQGPLLILNSDIVFHPVVIERLLKAKGDAFAYDSGSGRGLEHMKVNVENNHLVNMSKDMPASEVSGENVGILSLTGETVDALFQKAENLIDDGKENSWLGLAVCEIARERDIQAVDIASLPWGEIDFSYDLEKVRKEVWPAIQRYKKQKLRLSVTRWVAVVVVALLCALLIFKLQEPLSESSWDAIEMDNLDKVTITAGKQKKNWSLLEEKKNVELQVLGPTSVRIDSRLVILDETVKTAPYVLKVMLDGELIDWFMKIGRVSSRWVHPQWYICQSKKQGITLKVPEGYHVLRINLWGADSERCLLRVRYKEPDEFVD